MRYWVNAILTAVILTLAVIMPSLSGELLHYELYQDKEEGSFLYYLRSTFLSRNVAKLIFLGYFICIIMLGLQALLIKIGRTYLGVWVEQTWMENLSSSYFPFIAAITIGYRASLQEELMYRMFAICWGKKVFKNTIIAVIFASVVWGFAHSNYPIFPRWFRGIEVTCLGFLLSFCYLRYGIIPVIVAHYLFDVFWNSASFIFGISRPVYFFSSLAVLLVPLAFAAIAFAVSRREALRPMRWSLTKHQIYNLDILKTYLKTNESKYREIPRDRIKKEIGSHGWDFAVIDVAMEDLYGKT